MSLEVCVFDFAGMALMVGSLVAVACRALVATVFVLTAFWKMSHRHEFVVSFRRMAPTRVAGVAASALWVLAATEFAVAGILFAGLEVRGLSLTGPLAGAALIASFTVALALGEAGSCGCWFTPPNSGRGLKLLPLARNATLLGALIVAAILSPNPLQGVGFTAALSPLIAGIILAALLIEAPQIVAAVTFEPPPTRLGGVR